MNPEPNPSDLPDEASIQHAVVALRDLERIEAIAAEDLRQLQEDQQETLDRIFNATRVLQEIQEAHQDIQDRLASIRRQREHWNWLLHLEEERENRERIAARRTAQRREEEENDRVSERVTERLRQAEEAAWDRGHLVGNFVRVTYAGGQVRGVITERVTRRDYTVLHLDGTVHTLDIRFLTLTPPTNAERELLRNLEHPLAENARESNITE
jgi:hypothetical protein